MDEKVKNAQNIKDLTKGEKKETVKMVNKMTSTYEFITRNMTNMVWMAPDWDPHNKGIVSGLTFIHTLSLINLTRWLKRLTIVLIESQTWKNMPGLWKMGVAAAIFRRNFHEFHEFSYQNMGLWAGFSSPKSTFIRAKRPRGIGTGNLYSIGSINLLALGRPVAFMVLSKQLLQ